MEHDARAAGIAMALLRLARAAEAEAREQGQAEGLTPAQVAVLRFAAKTRPEMATPGQLARVLGVRAPTAVGIVNPLVERSLLERRPHPFDGRQSVLALTAAGWAAWARLERWQSGLAESLAALSPSELGAFEAALAKVVAAEVRAGRLVVSAPCAGCVHFRPLAHPGEPRPHRCALIARDLSEDEAAMECPEHTPAAR
ncbi:MarR family winged helix-turn-helix transcriptional regulator [Tepidiforma sp.]|uniref:MarR family winged helix-turn-helix transcriptional regulator n=1 Tax=Tepidiforma sp. TaxID=2682230 RepID=UPI002ADDCFF6|nr:MarR family transcriptional regulator [Tepidiforma sp.]